MMMLAFRLSTITGSIGAKSPCTPMHVRGLEHNGHLVPTAPLGDQVTPDAHLAWSPDRVDAAAR